MAGGIVVALDDEYQVHAEEGTLSEGPQSVNTPEDVDELSDDEIRHGLAVEPCMDIGLSLGVQLRTGQATQRSSLEVDEVGPTASENSIRTWFQRAVSSCLHNLVPSNWEDVAGGLTRAGASTHADFVGMSVAEARLVWSALAAVEPGFLDHLWIVLATMASTREIGGLHTQPVTAQSVGRRFLPWRLEEGPQNLKADYSNKQKLADDRTDATERTVRDLVQGIQALREARRNHTTPAPEVIAGSLRVLCRLPDNALQLRWMVLAGTCPPELPSARVLWLQRLQQNGAIEVEALNDALVDDSVWRCFCSWRRSALQYAVAVDLWGRAAKLCACQPWPPNPLVLSLYASLFRNGHSLRNYLSHLRMVLQLVESPVGILADTDALIRGSIKATPQSAYRYRARATAEQTRLLANSTRTYFERGDVADSWIVTRHFCVRYASVAWKVMASNPVLPSPRTHRQLRRPWF